MSSRFKSIVIRGEEYSPNLEDVRFNVGIVGVETDLEAIRSAAKADQFTGAVFCFGDEEHQVEFEGGTEVPPKARIII